MTDDTTSLRQRLKNCELSQLFIEELGWNHHRTAPLIVENDGVGYTLNAVAEKHGMVAYECQPGPGGQIPDYPTRGKIERQVARSAHEHIVVFINRERTRGRYRRGSGSGERKASPPPGVSIPTPATRQGIY